MKTIKDLMEIVGEKPFIWKNEAGEENYIQYIKINSELVNAFEINRGFDYGSQFINIELKPNLNLIDWFETSNELKSNLCTCDFVKVILTKGCQCGGQ